MTDTHLDQDAETPVNPYSLLEAVNRSSDNAHMAWLIFLAVMAYLMISVAGVTHKQLLLQTDVLLPVLGVPIPQVEFFRFAPVFLLLFHFGLISQLALLARKTHEFDIAVRHLEPGRRRSHPLRLELHNFFFVQGIAGPHRSLIMSLFLHAMTWLTLAILPVVLLLFVQISFLPYHDSLITWTHRIVLVLDIVVLILIGAFLTRAETNFFVAFWRNSIAHPLSFLMTAIILAVVLFFSFAVATIPDKFLDRTVKAFFGVSEKGGDAAGYSPFVQGFIGSNLIWRTDDGALFGIFHRNLIVQDADLVSDKDVSKGEPSLSLRGRDLRHAKLDRSDLHQADLTNAKLDEASLVNTNLANVRLNCVEENELLVGASRERARCASARGANFSGADLSGGNLAGIDLTGAQLEKTNLEGANLKLSLLDSANFFRANLRTADLTAGVVAQGTVFLAAQLEGADLNGALLLYADFSNAHLQAASLAHADLRGAILRAADLTGGLLNKARLAGADMAGAIIAGADMREASVWLTLPPAPDRAAHVDMRGMIVQPPSDADIEALKATIRAIDNKALRTAVTESLKSLLLAKSSDWTASRDYVQWQTLIDTSVAAIAAGGEFRNALTLFLENQLLCKARWADGSVAQGIARRARAQNFAGDAAAIYLRLSTPGDGCPGARNVAPATLQELAGVVDSRLNR